GVLRVGGDLRAGDLAFLVEDRRGDFLAPGVVGRLGRDVHGNVAQHGRVGLCPFRLDHDAHGAVVVDVGADESFDPHEAGRLHVLADEADDLADAVVDGPRRVVDEGLREQFLDGAGVLERDLAGEVVGQRDEVLALGDGGALAAHLDQGAELAVVGEVEADAALGGFAVALLGLDAGGLLAQDLDRLIHVAPRFGGGALAVHHGGVGTIAQCLDGRGGNRHESLLFIFDFRFSIFDLKNGRGRQWSYSPLPASAIENRKSKIENPDLSYS